MMTNAAARLGLARRTEIDMPGHIGFSQSQPTANRKENTP